MRHTDLFFTSIAPSRYIFSRPGSCLFGNQSMRKRKKTTGELFVLDHGILGKCDYVMIVTGINASMKHMSACQIPYKFPGGPSKFNLTLKSFRRTICLTSIGWKIVLTYPSEL